MIYVLYVCIIFHTDVKNPGNPYYLRQRMLCFGRFDLFYLSVSRITYKVMNRVGCIKLLSAVYLGPRNNLKKSWDDPDSRFGLRSVSRGGGLQSLTDCPVIDAIGVQLQFCFKIFN